jgi:hypothetical protein
MNKNFSYAYGYGKLECATSFLAYNMLKANLITVEQYEDIKKFIDDTVKRVVADVTTYSEQQ